MPACHTVPSDKKKFVSDIGEELVRRHGKRKYYSLPQVRRAARKQGYSPDLDCWAYSFYSSPEDFHAVHEAMGEVCDYAAMKSELLTEVSGGSFLPIDIDLSWLEWPDIDLSSIFDWFDFSP